MSSKTLKSIPLTAIIVGDSELAQRIREFDWSKTSMGPIMEWPQSTVTTINTALNSPIPIVMLWGKEGIMIYNDAYSVFASRRHPTLLGSDVEKGWPEVAEFNRNVMRTVLHKGDTLSYTNQQLTLYRNNRPEEVWMNLDYSPVIDETGSPSGVLAIVIETTQEVLALKAQREAEEALQIEREQLKVLLGQAPAAIAVVEGPKHIFTLANNLYKKVFNRTEKELIGKSIKEVFPEIEGQGIIELFDKVFRSGKPITFNEFPATFIRTKGQPPETGYFSFVAQPIKNTKGIIQSILVHAVEVTDQVVARREIENIASLNRTITENVTTGLLIMDNRHYCIFMNPAAEKITGYTWSKMKKIRKPLHDIIHHTRPDGTPYPLQECTVVATLPAEKTMSGEEVFVRPDGTFYPVSFTASSITQDDVVTGTIIEIRDITNEKRAQKEQQKLITLTNQRNELIKLNHAKDEFISLASHQLRTPATAVKQYISLLMSGFTGELNEDQKKFLQTAYDSNERQLRVINDLLKTAQIDSNRYILKKQHYVLSSIVRDAISDLQTSFDLKHQTVVFINEEDTTRVAVDRNEVKLAFINLLENASKYSYPRGVITVTITRKRQLIEVSVADQGVGISSENTHRIFEKFTRINNDLSDTVSGSGLGLYWIRRIIKLHGGTVKVQSELGKGSSFIVSLPI